jgi:hypothetical protein
LIGVNTGLGRRVHAGRERQEEDAMSRAEHRPPWTVLKEAADAPSRLRAWWRRRGELDAMDRQELERIAGDLGMSGSELQSLAARGPHAADELRERMRVLGITGADVEQTALGLMRDLERTCSYCQEKGRCRKDLAEHPDAPDWAGYCPNAIALTAVGNARHHASDACRK